MIIDAQMALSPLDAPPLVQSWGVDVPPTGGTQLAGRPHARNPVPRVHTRWPFWQCRESDCPSTGETRWRDGHASESPSRVYTRYGVSDQAAPPPAPGCQKTPPACTRGMHFPSAREFPRSANGANALAREGHAGNHAAGAHAGTLAPLLCLRRLISAESLGASFPRGVEYRLTSLGKLPSPREKQATHSLPVWPGRKGIEAWGHVSLTSTLVATLLSPATGAPAHATVGFQTPPNPLAPRLPAVSEDPHALQGVVEEEQRKVAADLGDALVHAELGVKEEHAQA